MTPAPPPEAVQRLAQDLQRLFDLGGGTVTLVLLHTPGAMALVDEAILGDLRAKTIVGAAEDLLQRMENIEGGAALACLLCSAGALSCGELLGGIGVLLPSGVEHTACAVAFCANCTAGRSEAELTGAVVAKLRGTLLPDLRLLPPTMPYAGHA